MDERTALDRLAAGLPEAGDDAAVVDGLVLTTDMLQGVIEAANIGKNEIAVTIGKIVCNSITAFEDLATELIETSHKFTSRNIDVGKVLWKMHLTGVDSVVSLAGSGIFDELGDGDWGCASCIAAIRLFLDVGVCGFGVSAACAAISWWSFGLGTAACATALGAVCSYGVMMLPDARDLCSPNTEPEGWGPC
jgi:hypothetical protein